MTKSVAQIVREASDIASKVKPDSLLNKELVADAERTKESKVCTIVLKEGLVELFGEEGLNDLPEPGTGPEGNNPDVFIETIPNSKRERKSSFWKETFLRVPFVAKESRHLELVKNQLSKEPAKDNSLKDKTNAWLEAEKKAASARVNAAVNRGLNAIRLYWQESRISEYPNVELEYCLDEQSGEMERRANPIVIHRLFPENDEAGKPHPKAGQRMGIARYFSVGELLALDIAKAEETGTWQALLDSGKREDSDKQTKLAEAVNSEGTLDDYITSLWYYAAQSEKNYDRAVNYLLNPDNASARRAFYEFEIWLDKVISHPRVRKAIDKTMGEEKETETHEREEKVKTA